MSISTTPVQSGVSCSCPAQGTGAKKFKLPKIDSPGPDISKREMAELAATKKFDFELVPKSQINEWMTIKVTDGKKRIFNIEIFDALYSKKTCTCNQFFQEESGWCQHLAAFEGLEKFGWNEAQQDVILFKQAIARDRVKIPITTRLYRQGALCWDPLTQDRVVHGKVPVVTENWKAYCLWKQNQVMVKTKVPQSFSSVGILENNLNLFDYQETVFEKMLNAKRAICSMSLGSGKTLTTMTCYGHLKMQKENATLLVVAPKSLCLQWVGELKRGLKLNATWIDKPEKMSKLKTEAGPFIVTYQYATKFIDELKKHTFDMVIVDEIQFVKNGSTKTWKGLSQIKSEYFYGLSGTVIENRLDDLYSIMQIVNPASVGPLWKFNLKFQEISIVSKVKIVFTGVKNLDKLKEQLKDYIFFYDNVKLPSITHERIIVDMNSVQKGLHDFSMGEAEKLMAKSLTQPLTFGEKAMVQAYYLKARQAAQGVELCTKTAPTAEAPLSNKMIEFEKLLKEVCLVKKEKIVVFSEWTEHLKIAQRVADSLGLKNVFFTGDESAKKRNDNVNLYKTDPNIQVFFSSDAGGVGLDGLQLVANNVVHLELPWNPSRLDQRTGRVHRYLQTKDVTAYYIICKGSIEDQIENRLTEKRDTRNQTLRQFG